MENQNEVTFELNIDMPREVIRYEVYPSYEEEETVYVIVPIYEAVEEDNVPDRENDDIIIMPLAAPAPITNTTVSANDLNTFVGSGAHDFIAYRTTTDTSYCIYPVKIEQSGRVVSNGNVNTITIRSVSGNRTVTYGSDSIDRYFTGASYQYSDMTGPYITAWNANSVKSPVDMLYIYMFIAFCCVSLFGSLVRRK